MSDIQDLRVLALEVVGARAGRPEPGCSLRALLMRIVLFSSCPRARQCRDPVKPQPLNSAVIREAFWINSPVKGIPLKCLFVWKKNPFIIEE